MSSCSISARVKRADKKYNIGEYYAAADMYKQVYKQVKSKDKKTRAHVAFNQAECYRILNNSKAVNAYKNAIRYHYHDSIVYLHYAQVLQYQGKYKDAIKQYDIYLEGHPSDYVAQAGKYACLKVEEWKQQYTRYKIAPAKEFNAKRSSNFSPAFITADGDALVFTSNRHEQQSSNKKKTRNSSVTGMPTFNLYSARKNAAGKWEEIELCEGLYSETEGEEEETTQKQTPNAMQTEAITYETIRFCANFFKSIKHLLFQLYIITAKIQNKKPIFLQNKKSHNRLFFLLFYALAQPSTDKISPVS
jgi:peptidoglycan-associated lipoprotein